MFLPSRAPSTSSIQTPSGAALVLVLAALSLIAFFLITIMTLVNSEGRGAHTAADLVQARMLSLLPEKLVISQIRRATGTPDDLQGNAHTWASQPGMIRVFGTTPDPSKARAKVDSLYKLYSARKIKLTAAQEQDADDGPVAEANRLLDWQKNPGEFVDLNEPVRVEPVRNGSKPYFVFPIVDPAAVGLVDGFKVHSPTTDTDGESPPAQANTDTYNPNTEQPKLAMPVTWLYVLQDGSVIAPNRSVNPGVIHFGGSGNAAAVPSEGNPIVGRIAYWTDDDSCKLNVNTATEPAPWEPPHTHTTTDESYAQTIPAKGEFYRNSGHPAYTSLSPVLRHFGTTGGGIGTTAPSDPPREPDNTIGATDWSRHIENWHRWLPRTFDTSGNADKGTLGGTQPATSEVAVKQDRLFASVDEMIFKAEASAGGTGRTEYLANDPKLNPEDLSKVRFFLTTHNRAPELNLFNRPKISLWPLPKVSPGALSTLNDIDRKFALACILGNQLYCFERDSAWSTTTPGSAYSLTDDWGIARNQEIYGYLQSLTEMDVPGFGDTFVNKYGERSRNQLLTAMFDMDRWNVNPATPLSSSAVGEYSFLGRANGSSGASGEASWSAVPAFVPESQGLGEPDGPGTALQPTRGYGRWPTVSEVALVFVAVKNSALPFPATPSEDNPDLARQTPAVRVFVVVQPYNPVPGIPAATPSVRYEVQGLETIILNGASVATPRASIFNRAGSTTSALVNSVLGVSTGSTVGNGFGPGAGFGLQFISQPWNSSSPPTIKTVVPLNTTGLSEDTNFTLVTDTILLPPPPPPPTPGAPNLLTVGGTGPGGSIHLELIIWDGQPSGVPIQRFELNFPPTVIPAPRMRMNYAQSTATADDAIQFRITPVKSTNLPAVLAPDGVLKGESQQRLVYLNLIQPGDVVRSMAVRGSPVILPSSTAGYLSATKGDMRLVASHVYAGSTAGVFQPHPDYEPPAGGLPAQLAHTLHDGGLPLLPAPRAEERRLVGRTGESAPAPATPAAGTPVSSVPPGTPGAFNADGRAGDFDTGLGIIEDGAYITTFDKNSGINQVGAPPSGTTGGYFQTDGVFNEENGITFSPWRQAASAFMFGSLPSGVYGRGSGLLAAPRPWQTLLFCPNPASRTTPPGTEPTWDAGTPTQQDHFGFLTPRDHLWLENFWMPVVEPDGMSAGFSTEGKVNMNYQIVPFFWIKRASAMHGALQGVRITAIPSKATVPSASTGVGEYKDKTASTLEFRYSVDAEKTLAAFDDRFFDPATKMLDVFRSPSEICDMFLIPKELPNRTYTKGNVIPPTVAAVFPDNDHDAYKKALEWWEGPVKTDPTDGFEATGDNLREAPYAQLYPRLCTRSNVFTVHYRVQVLRKSRSTLPSLWDETRDKVVAEYRGQSTIERYLDPKTQSANLTNDGSPPQTIPDFASVVANESLDDYYKYRVTNRKRFSP